MEFPERVEPPHEFRSSNAFPEVLLDEPHFSRRGSQVGYYEHNSDDISNELYHGYAYPCNPESVCAAPTQQNTFKRKQNAASRHGSKRSSKTDEYFD